MRGFVTVQAVLQAFVSLVTHPLEQSLQESVKAATASVVLVGLTDTVVRNSGAVTIHGIGGPSLLIVLVWLALTAVIAKPDRRSLAIARNLSLVSFWMAITLVLVLAAKLVVSAVFDRSLRFVVVLLALLVLVPLHLFRTLRAGIALGTSIALVASMGILAWQLIS